MVSNKLTLIALFSMLLSTPIPSSGQDVAWFTGNKLTQMATDVAVSVDWQAAPLRQRLNELADSVVRCRATHVVWLASRVCQATSVLTVHDVTNIYHVPLILVEQVR